MYALLVNDDARAAEYDRHPRDLEEYRSGKNKNDVASDGADMTEQQVENLKSGKLLRQRLLTAKELRVGGEFSECVDCDIAMDSSSGSTPFLKGGGGLLKVRQTKLIFGPPKLQNTVLRLSSLVRPNTTRRFACNRSSRKQMLIVNMKQWHL